MADAVPPVLRLGWQHDSACLCVPCRKAAYLAAKAKVDACTRIYQELRAEAGSRPAETSRARQDWTAARQELALADHEFRGAEDRDRFAAAANATLEELRLNPEELPW